MPEIEMPPIKKNHDKNYEKYKDEIYRLFEKLRTDGYLHLPDNFSIDDYMAD